MPKRTEIVGLEECSDCRMAVVSSEAVRLVAPDMVLAMSLKDSSELGGHTAPSLLKQQTGQDLRSFAKKGRLQIQAIDSPTDDYFGADVHKLCPPQSYTLDGQPASQMDEGWNHTTVCKAPSSSLLPCSTSTLEQGVALANEALIRLIADWSENSTLDELQAVEGGRLGFTGRLSLCKPAKGEDSGVVEWYAAP